MAIGMTDEQRQGREALAQVAPGFRILRDLEGFAFVPGRRHRVPPGDANGRGYDRLEWLGGDDDTPFAVYVAARKLSYKLAPLLAIPGVRAVQRGDAEARCLVPPEAIPAVLAAIKARRRRAGHGKGRLFRAGGDHTARTES